MSAPVVSPTRPAAGPNPPSSLPTGGRPLPPLPGKLGEKPAGAAGDARRPPNGQDMRALTALAASKRHAYCQVKAEIASMSADRGRVAVANHLRCPNDTVAGLEIGRLLGAIRRVGDHTVISLLARVGIALGAPRPISERKRIGELTDRQRNAIADALMKGIR